MLPPLHLILGRPGAAQPVHHIAESGEQVEHNNGKKYGRHNKMNLSAAKVRRFERGTPVLGHRQA